MAWFHTTAFSLVTINIGMPKHSVKKQIPNINNVALWKTFPTKKTKYHLIFSQHAFAVPRRPPYGVVMQRATYGLLTENCSHLCRLWLFFQLKKIHLRLSSMWFCPFMVENAKRESSKRSQRWYNFRANVDTTHLL